MDDGPWNWAYTIQVLNDYRQLLHDSRVRAIVYTRLYVLIEPYTRSDSL